MMELDTHPHPNPQPNPHHRKIDVQSPADLVYLQRNLSLAATEKLNLHFPPKHAYATHIPLGLASAPENSDSNNNDNGASSQQHPPALQADPLRARVEELVTAFLRQTWDSAKEGISVNGMDAAGVSDFFTPQAPTREAGSTSIPAAKEEQEREGIDFQYEAYDPRLGGKLASLYAEVEALTATVSNLRRTNPRSGAQTYLDGLTVAMDGDEALYQTRREEQAARQMSAEEILRMPGIPSGTSDMYERGLSGLAALGGMSGGGGGGATAVVMGDGERKPSSLTETVGKVQRARRVVGELE